MSYVFDSVQINNFILGVTNPIRQKVRVASTGNVTLSACIAGTTMDGVELAIDDRVLLKNQTSLVENGVYRVQETDPLVRTDDLYNGEPFSGFLFVVQEGTVNAAKMFACTNAKGVDVSATDELKFAEYAKLDATVNVVNGNIVTWQNGQLADSGQAISGLGSSSLDPAVVNSGSAQYTLATTRGTNGQVLTTDGSGGTSWQDKYNQSLNTGDGVTFSHLDIDAASASLSLKQSGTTKWTFGNDSSSGMMAIKNGSGVDAFSITQGLGTVVAGQLTLGTGSNTNVFPTSRGTSGQVLGSTDSSGQLGFVSVSSVGAHFPMVHSTMNVNSLTTGTLSSFNYNNSMYSSLPTTGICSFWIDAPSSAAIYFDVHDGTSVLGSTVVPTTSGAGSYKFDFTRPSSDKLLSLRSKLQSLNIIGTNVYAAQFKF